MDTIMNIKEENTLSSIRVEEIFNQCLFKEVELDKVTKLPMDTGFVKVEGISNSVGFHPERLADNKDNIIELVSQLDHDLFIDGGSFLKLCKTNDGVQWGDYDNMEQLMMLSIAVDICEFLLPRESWPLLPGCTPYIRLNINGNNDHLIKDLESQLNQLVNKKNDIQHEIDLYEEDDTSAEQAELAEVETQIDSIIELIELQYAKCDL